MTPVEPWAQEKRGHAEQLYALLTALIGDLAFLRGTSASLSWRTAAGVQGHWREESGQIWLGRIVWTSEGRQSEQLVLALAPLEKPPVQGAEAGEDDTRLVYPRAHYGRMADGPVVGFDPDTPQLYEAAHALLTQLSEELRTMLPPRSAAQEASP